MPFMKNTAGTMREAPPNELSLGCYLNASGKEKGPQNVAALEALSNLNN